MDSGATFSMKVVAYDRRRKKGGEIIEYSEAELARKNKEIELVLGQRAMTPIEVKKQQLLASRDPHHKKWYTRNIRVLQNGHPTSLIKKIHPPLVLEFNGQKVVP